MMQWAKQKQQGFTIVELLIVVVVIAILAAITIVGYNGIQAQARQSKINIDIAQLEKAILTARNSKGGMVLKDITNSTATGGTCWGKPTGTDLAALPASDNCWAIYTASLRRISDASGINVHGLVDPWGRPYYMDENDGENCNPDQIGYYAQPFTTGQTMIKLKNITRLQTC